MTKSIDYISASDIANYVVCPEAWRLKNQKNSPKKDINEVDHTKNEKKSWGNKTQLFQSLKTYAKIALILLFTLTLLAYIFEYSRSKFIIKLLNKYGRDYQEVVNNDNSSFLLQGIPVEIFAFICILALIIFLWDLFERRKNLLAKEVGLRKNTKTVSIKGISSKEEISLISEDLKLRSKPDALIMEKNILIPLDYHPFAKKVKDRHVAQMMLHLKLISQTKNQKTPYGVIILGKEKREVRIKNSIDKQKWLDCLIDEMRSIQTGVPAVAKPSFYKCKNCEVENICNFTAYKGI